MDPLFSNSPEFGEVGTVSGGQPPASATASRTPSNTNYSCFRPEVGGNMRRRDGKVS